VQDAHRPAASVAACLRWLCSPAASTPISFTSYFQKAEKMPIALLPPPTQATTISAVA